MFHLVHHVLQRPNLSAPFLAEIRLFNKTIAMRVRDNDGVNGFKSEVLAHALKRLVKELFAKQAAIRQ